MNQHLLHINDTPDLSVLKQKVLRYNPEANIALIEKAYNLAMQAHSSQKRADGTPYFFHPFNVALILAELKMDSTCISAGLLHDVVEDTDIKTEYISEQFSPVLAKLVEGVTKITKLAFKTKAEHQAENIRKMLLAMSEDIRVIIVKLADRLNNVLTLGALAPEKQKRIALETLEIYAPLSHRLGMHQIKSLLEDGCFKAISPSDYSALVDKLENEASSRDLYIETTISRLQQAFRENGMKTAVYGRTKHLYSIHRKISRDTKSLSDIYDLLAVRVITGTVRDCYAALGIVHDLWIPMPGRFKDYIAMPKQNMYQSLHTTVMQKLPGNAEAFPLEIQIRTEEMDRVAEVGIAAHWDYKEMKSPNENQKINQKIVWLRQLIDWHSEIHDADDFIHNLKNDLFHDEVFVFTPAGDVVALPASATPLDFAFTVHTEVGLRCSGARVNSRIVPLEHILRNGDVVEVMTSNQAHPNPSWLNIVKSHRAKNKIRQHLRKQERELHLQRGKEILNKNLRKMHQQISKVKDEFSFPLEELNWNFIQKSPRLKEILNDGDLRDNEDVIAAIGSEKLSFTAFFNRIFPEWNQFLEAQKRLKRLSKSTVRKVTQGIIVEGIDNPLLNFSKCCNPLPGDPISGYITRGKGISVHRSDCPNLASLKDQSERLIRLEWDPDQIKKNRYNARIRMEVSDRPSMLLDVTQILSTQLSLNITNLSARPGKNGLGLIDIQVEMDSTANLEAIIGKLQQIPEVVNVYRLK